MAGPDELKAALERLAAGAGTNADCQALRQALQARHIVVATGERAVALGRDATDAIIVTGNGNVVIAFKGGEAAAIRQALASLFPPRLHQIPADLPDFTGRKQGVEELLRLLRWGAGRAAISAIRGMGGVGKTALAIHVAHRLVERYPDAQIFVNLRGTSEQPLTPAEVMANIIHAFHPEARLPNDPDQVAQVYRSILTGQRALILLDAAVDSAQVRPLMPPEGCALLVTSRNALTLPGMTPIMLDQLQPIEARELLVSIAPRTTPEIADQICSLCGYLPLAIRAAGSLLAVTIDLDPVDYAAQLREERRRLEHLGIVGVDMGVEASFNLSCVRLRQEAAHVFRQLAVFPGSFDAQAEEKVCKDADHIYLSDLVRRSLVIYDSAAGRYRLHDLMRLFAGGRLDPETGDDAARRHAAHYLDVLGRANELFHQRGEALKRGLELVDAEWGNMQAGQRWAEKHATGDDVAARLCKDYPNAGAGLLDLRQHPREGIRWLESGLAAARRLKDRPAEVTHLAMLGGTYANLGKPRHAIEFHEQALAIFREVGSREGEGRVLGDLGNDYVALGKYSRAVEFYKETLAIFRELGDREGAGSTLSNLGVVYANLGELRHATECCENGLAILREVGDRRNEAAALMNKGEVHGMVGEFHRAAASYAQALAIYRELGFRGGEGDALFHMSWALEKLNNSDQAIDHAEAALKIFEQFEDPNATKVRQQLAEWREQK